MGLDNYPSPYPCKIRGYAKYTQDGRIDCNSTPCPFKRLKHKWPLLLGAPCWLGGRFYSEIVRIATDNRYDLYRDLQYNELEEILNALKNLDEKHLFAIAITYIETKPIEDKDIEYLKKAYIEPLIQYLETLLKEVEPAKDKFKLVAWY